MRILAVTAVLGLSYLLLAGQPSGEEAMAGLGAVFVAGLYAYALHHCADRPMLLGAPWLRLLASTLRAIAADTARVGWVLLRGGGGTLSRQPFRPGRDDAADAGRRALVTLALSLAPNGTVIEIGADALVMHRLLPQDPAADREWPL